MNAGGVLNTCKSNGEPGFGPGISGERVRNTWAICLKVGDSSAKAELIPHVITGDIFGTSKVAQATAF